jgi:hypothetical protein
MDKSKREAFEKSNIAGGHPFCLWISDELGDHVIIKRTKDSEVDAYERIFNSDPISDPRSQENLLMQKFLPKYYGSCS